ncbi:MAG: NifB/NifX family molybdenum-iron cluster-binding protein [Sulfuricurvum sp.]|uniref:NifB/NifX family molybdenum-iron cluster-binding protein n=1 Tax=Sulfuricurvum sp. TaxID=2025608 RepID=UPI0026340439|nr:NifB/NifX family molybdenum-iron cluster-binding protein [Sulfuricurvum sp.]MDD2369467.1 NifB/NifX family molybdenum-iron cluster-binding protein [Sulfuricurvum sp.]MDD5117053.1 NifB/NifX family molybdenum-iron cluster-binding protein [Sulfuricurvum sp.]
MIIAMPIKTSSLDAALAPLFGNAKFFAFATDTTQIDVVKMDQLGGRDVARTLVANNVDVLITSHLGLNPFALLKSYGIKVYFAGEERLTISNALKLFYANELIEVTSNNFDSLLGEHDHHGETHGHSHSHGHNCCGQHSHA